MSKRVVTCVIFVAFCSVIITQVFGHQQWILPNFFYTDHEFSSLGIEHTWSDQRFVSERGSGTLLSIIHPEGWRMGPSSTYVGQTRTVAEIELQQPGTYRIETARPAEYWTQIEANGKKEWVTKPKDQLPGVKIIQSEHRWFHTTTFVTVEKHTQSVLEATGVPLEIVPLTHPNKIVVDKPFVLQVLSRGQSVPDQKVEVYSEIDSGHDAALMTAVTNADGKCELIFPSPGRHLLIAKLRQEAKDSSRANIDDFSVSMLVEVRRKNQRH